MAGTRKRKLVALSLAAILLFSHTFSTGVSVAKYVLEVADFSISVKSASTFKLISIEAPTGDVRVGETLTVGDLVPDGATATYVWQIASVPDEPEEPEEPEEPDEPQFVDIPDADDETYVLKASDVDKLIRVKATGYGSYTETIYSYFVGPVQSAPLVSIGSIVGDLGVDEELEVGALLPLGATATYKWLVCDTEEGEYDYIEGAESSTYTPTADDVGSYLKVEATGKDGYSGTVTSDARGAIPKIPLSNIGVTTGTLEVGDTLSAGTLEPLGATADYQWRRSGSSDGTGSTPIQGATGTSYVLTSSDEDCYLIVQASGTGIYTGTVSSIPVGPVTVPEPQYVLTGIGSIVGDVRVGETLTAGALVPSGATATYQWQSASSSSGPFQDIASVTSNAYEITANDWGKYLRVVATGSDLYVGTAVSDPVGAVGKGIVTAISPIVGSTVIGYTLTAGTLTPPDATVTYEWSYATGTTFTVIAGATGNTLKVVGTYSNAYIKVTVRGTGAYEGEVWAISQGRVTSVVGQLDGIGPIGGTTQVGQVLTAGVLNPTSAAATYQWYRADAENGTYTPILGALSTTYTLGAADYGKWVKVEATGAGSYQGTVESDPVGPVASCLLSSVGTIIGTASVGETLAVGSLTPPGATVTYQWKRSPTLGGTYEEIAGATSSTYKLTAADSGHFFVVTVSGTGGYTGTLTSAYVGPVSSTTISLTSIGAIGGTLRVGELLVAGTLEPEGATATYRWMRASSVNGPYTPISGATGTAYTLTAYDDGKYLQLEATGSGSCKGTVLSAPSGPVGAGVIQGISTIVGSTHVNQTLSAGTVTPLGATVTYQWQKSMSGADDQFEDITNEVRDSLIVIGSWSNCYIRLKVTGTGAYTGTVYSDPTITRVGWGSPTAITKIEVISGTARVGETLTAGALTPSGAAATYQWQVGDSSGGTFTNIPGATSRTYDVTSLEYGKYLRVRATGSGGYSGVVTSDPTGPVQERSLSSIGPVSGSCTVGSVLSAGTVSPDGATVQYQWMWSAQSGGTYTPIPGATNQSYTLVPGDMGLYFKVSATGQGAYTGSVTSAPCGPVGDAATPIETVGTPSGTTQVGSTLTAGELTPYGATATYQWQRANDASGPFTDIEGAQLRSYTLGVADYDKYLRVKAIGSGQYSGVVPSGSVGPVTKCPIIGITDVIGSTVTGYTLTAGTVIPYGATVAYQWQVSDTAGMVHEPPASWEDVAAATSNTFVVMGQWSYRYVRVKVTGTGVYTGTIYSARTVTRISDDPPDEITDMASITGTPKVGSTLTAGALTPAAATATYQWQGADSESGDYTDIFGAAEKTYDLGPSDVGSYFRVRAIGSGNYKGEKVSDPIGPVVGIELVSLGDISGIPMVGETLTAGAVEPALASVDYQWLSSDGESDFLPISGAVGNTYTVEAGDEGLYLMVEVTGKGAYSGKLSSNVEGPVWADPISLESIGPVSGVPLVGSTLTAGSIEPSGATVIYQWLRGDGVEGDFSPISGETSATYVIAEEDEDYYLKVQVTGTGIYEDTVTSDPVGPIVGEPVPLVGIGSVSGTASVGKTLTAGSLDPAGATATYQWQRASTDSEEEYVNINGAESATYVVTASDYEKYLRVVAVGSGLYSGSRVSAAVGPITPGSITGIGPITGLPEVGETLNAGALVPAGATATYQWQRASTDSEEEYVNINGAESATYVVTASDYGKYLRVVAVGYGAYGAESEPVASDSVGPVEPGLITDIGPITGSPRKGQTLTAGAVVPAGAEGSVTYQWEASAKNDDTTWPTQIPGATQNTYYIANNDYKHHYIRVTVTGTGAYTGSVSSASVGPVQ